jgi:hypothetical protein
MKFPIYRKYKGIDVWFKIDDIKSFTEYKKIGQQLITHKVNAKIFPEQQFIKDMIDCYEDRWDVVSEKDFNRFLNTFMS